MADRSAKIGPSPNFAHMSEPFFHRLRRGSVEWGLLGTGGAGKARVLMYHGIGEAGCHRVNVRHLSTELFERHLKLFTAHFNVVPLQALLHGARHPDKLTVALSFDDGLRNNRTHALPLLEKYHVPAAFFITGANPCGLRILWGDLLDLGERHTDQDLQVSGRTWRKNEHGRYAEHGNGLLLRDHIKQSGVWGPKQDLYDQLGALVDGPLQADHLFWELMSDDELRRFAQHPLVTLGSHGWWHNDMGRIPAGEVIAELTQSRDHLAENQWRSTHAPRLAFGLVWRRERACCCHCGLHAATCGGCTSAERAAKWRLRNTALRHV